MRQAGYAYLTGTIILLLAGCQTPHQVNPERDNAYPIYDEFLPDRSASSPASAVEAAPLPELSEKSTLDDYLAHAAMNNPGLEAGFYRWQSAIDQIPQAQALPDPELTFGQYVRQSDMQMDRMVGVMQMLPWFGTLEARGSAAYARAQAAAEELDAVWLDLYRQVKKEFYEYLYLREAIEIAEQNLALIARFEQVALTKYVTAAGTHPDIIRAQIELATLDEVLVSLRELIKPQTARLNAILNRPADAPLPWPQKPAFGTITATSEQLNAWLKEKNPKLASMGWMIEAAKQEHRLARLKSVPNIGVGVEWTDFEKSGGSSGRDSVLLMFRMNLPIWTDSYKAAERQARANIRTAAQQKQQIENELAAEAAVMLYELEESQRKITLYEGIIPKTEQLVSASEAAYRSDSVDFLSLIDAQRLLLQYHLEYRRMQTNYQQILAGLEALVGTRMHL